MRLLNKLTKEEENIAEASFSLPKIPKQLKEELDRFSDRNCLVALENSYEAVCEQCLKAHLLAEAKKMNLSKKLTESIKDSLKGKIGHNGYYMDQDKIIRIKRS
jgi:hypothetical protein